MTGPEHYVEAERLATGIHERMQAVKADIEANKMNMADVAAVSDAMTATLALAQVHATLALAAATAVAPGLWTTAWDEAIT